MKDRTSLKRWILVSLFALGAIEICYGFIVGPYIIFVRESAMYSDFVAKHDSSTDVLATTLGNHVEALMSQWHVVAAFGIANILLGLLFLRQCSMQVSQKNPVKEPT